MHHYPHHIGDYSKDTPGLTTLEHGAYRLLMDAYYASEAPLPEDEVYAIAKAMTPQDRKAVDKVLRKYFTQHEGAFHQKRIDAEIAKFHGKSDKASQAARIRWGNAGAMQTHSERNADASPKQSECIAGAMPTSNQEPVTSSTKRASRLPEDWQLPTDWLSWALAEKPKWDEAWARRTADRFRDFWIAKPGRAGCKLDWLATWRNWVRDTKDPTFPLKPETFKPWEGAH